NTLEAVVGAALLQRAGFDRRFERLRDVFLLVALAALGSTTVSATFGLLSALLGHLRLGGRAAGVWSGWWVGGVLGDLLVAPLLFAWMNAPHLGRSPVRWLEAALLALLLVLVSGTVFQHAFVWPVVRAVMQGTYPIVPLLIWAALRFEVRGVTAA